MRALRITGLAIVLGAWLAAQAAPPGVGYATGHIINEADSDAVRAEKAAKVLPRPNQTAWMRLERTVFLHFGVNTFNEVEWGSGREDPAIFNPTDLDADQWLRTVTGFGGKMIVLVAKHHDGFAMWPSRYTAHSSAASPWRGGKGDLVREVSRAAQAHGVKMAVYLSPADLYQLKTNPANPAGYYGNGSPKRDSTIPTRPARFKDDPSQGRAPTPGFGTYRYVVNDYNRYFLNQLYELLTEYGPISEVWFDGANPDPSVPESYDYAAWYDLIRHLQPKAVIMGKGPDVRWVGTESGYGRTTEWSVVPLPAAPAQFVWPDMQDRDLGSRAQLKAGSHLWWYPAETNVTVLADGQWFWAPAKRPRPVPQLVDIYYASIGRNGNLILNLSPDKRGLIPDDQLETMGRLSSIVNETFASNLASGGKVAADRAAAGHPPVFALDRRLDTWWEAAPGHTSGTVTLTLPSAVTFDVVSLQEAVDHRSQRIESFVLETWDGSAWQPAQPIDSDELTTVGHRRLIRLKTPVTTRRMRVRITASRLAPTLAEIGLFRQATRLLPPTISDRAADGSVSLAHPGANRIVYTLDGTTPALDSPTYHDRIRLPSSATVNATAVLPGGGLGIMGSRRFAGLVPDGWKVVEVDSEETLGANNAAARAVDGDSTTYWHTRWREDQKLPHAITIDLGAALEMAGFTYLPRQDGSLNGTVESYRFETSLDGVEWTTCIDAGTFANIRNSPTLQQVGFAPVRARYFRFTALQEVYRNGWTSAAELSVVPAARAAKPEGPR